MALAKRGTRIIVVGAERYRWVVSPDDEPGLAIVVECANGAGQRLVTWVEHRVVIAPGLVAAVIEQASRHLGWTPGRRGGQLTLRCTDPHPTAATVALVPWPQQRRGGDPSQGAANRARTPKHRGGHPASGARPRRDRAGWTR